MKRIVKIGIVVTLVTILSISAVAYTLIQNEKIPIMSIKNPDLYIDSFDDIDFEIKTDKEKYALGEKVEITAILQNSNDTDKKVFLNGWTNYTTGEQYIPFNFKVYTSDLDHIWSASTVPTNVTPPILIIPPSEYTFNITINASSEYAVSYLWNQTIKTNDTWQSVPAGEYLVVANVDINWEHYYGGIPYHRFGNMKQITIEG